MTSGRLLTILMLCTALAATAACGRKAPLDTPYEAAIEAREQAEENNEPLPPKPEPPETDRPFILDPLIE